MLTQQLRPQIGSEIFDGTSSFSFSDLVVLRITKNERRILNPTGDVKLFAVTRITAQRISGLLFRLLEFALRPPA
jgi:hypothetical protein